MSRGKMELSGRSQREEAYLIIKLGALVVFVVQNIGFHLSLVVFRLKFSFILIKNYHITTN